MSKTKSVYVCNECGKEHPKWAGRCSECGEWNTLEEVKVESRGAGSFGFGRSARGGGLVAGTNVPMPIGDIQSTDYQRIPLPMPEFSRVLGGGVVPGSLVLVGGDPGIGKCVVGSTRVFDPVSGAYLPITEWEDQPRSVLAVDDTSLQLHSSRSTHFHHQGVRPVVEVTTKLGRVLTCTPSHPVLTPDGWQPVGELTSGTYIASPRALPYFGSDEMDAEKVKLIAYILSDGSAQSDINVTTMLPEVVEDLEVIAAFFRMSLKKYDKKGSRAALYRFVKPVSERLEIRRKVAYVLREAKAQAKLSVNDLATAVGVPSHTIQGWLDARSLPSIEQLETIAQITDFSFEQIGVDTLLHGAVKTPIALYLEEIGLRYTNAFTKTVPECIFGLSKNAIALFLKTIFTCDGSLYVNAKGKAGVSYTTVSHRLAEDIQHLLLRFGLIAKLRTKPMTVNEQPYTAYELILLGLPNVKQFLAQIGIMGRHEAKERIAAMSDPVMPSTQRDVVPTGNIFWSNFTRVTQNQNFAEISRQVGLRVKNRRHERPLTRYTVAAFANAYPDPYFTSLAHGDVYWDEIVSIMPAGEAPVYDITVKDHANFVANDLIIHNSTLMGQVSGQLAEAVGSVLYISGEESVHQIKMRAERLGVVNKPLFLLSETNLDVAIEHINNLKPKALVVDSIQTVYLPDITSSAGSVSQVRECAARLMQLAKGENLPTFLVGHVTKEGAIAGPRVLEHIVDTVLYLEGERYNSFRLLRAQKNRFGSTNEVGVFEMIDSGLIEVANPSEAFLSEHATGAPGSAVAVTMEGTRPLLCEIQSLVTNSAFSQPRRTSNGVDLNRLHLLLAVLSKRLGLPLHTQDVFVNIVGGLKITEPAADLAVAAAIVSSFREKSIPRTMTLIGEIGLGGELRNVSQLDKRMYEAAKLGFTHCIVPRNTRRPVQVEGIEAIPVRTLVEALHLALQNPGVPEAEAEPAY